MQLYYNPASAPCRAVMLFLQTINLTPEMKLINMEAGDHLKPDYIKMNPQHTIPLLIDGNFILSESRAILGYLADKYASNMPYYPSEPMARGVVNQRLMFDIGTLYQRIYETYLVPLFKGENKINEEAYKKTQEAFAWLETFIGNAPYMAGDRITIADYSLMATISSANAAGLDLTPYQKIQAWFNKCKTEMKGYEAANGDGAKLWGDMIKAALNIN